ncbi:MAG: hypothetical protein ACLQSR_16300 [Limisphaerales bacterium]
MKRNSKALPPLPERAAKMLARFKHVRGISDEEKSLPALGLAATPEERWDLVRNHLSLFHRLLRAKHSKARRKV